LREREREREKREQESITSTPFLRQKVTLWQHADELEQEQVSMGTWIDSKDVVDCMGCGSNFTAFKRKVQSNHLAHEE
jgi:hypothetical protein